MFPRIWALVLVTLLAAGSYVIQDRLTAPLPQIGGQMALSCLHDRVEVYRDVLGVPHVYASNLHDLFAAQGYVQAQDRWWQMEFWRHTASGTLGELIGRNESSVRADVYLRTLGWRGIAERELEAMDPETRDYLQAFSEGVNEYIRARKPKELAVEYSLLGLMGVTFQIDPWTPLDTLVFAKLMAYDMSLEESRELLRGRLYEILGPAMTDAWLTPAWPFGERPTIVQEPDIPSPIEPLSAAPASATAIASRDAVAHAGDPALGAILGTGPGGGSNAWVVDGTLTASGLPLLANDTHVAIALPSIWYEIGLHCVEGDDPAFDVVGFAFAASPGVVVGHNADIAWGIANAYVDAHDAYVLRVNPEDPLQYEWDGEWRAMTTRQETIRFGDGSPAITLVVRETHLGPITSDHPFDPVTQEPVGFDSVDPIARRWTALDPGDMFHAVFEIDRATSWETFREALGAWTAPALHFVYADTSGNIGYQLAGQVPIRSIEHNGLVPTAGWTSATAWTGFLPFDLLPHVANPERGFLVAANQAIAPPGYEAVLAARLGEAGNYTISEQFDYGYRAERITELLTGEASHTVASFVAIQGDAKLLNVAEVLAYLAVLAVEARLQPGLELLLDWDQRFDGSSSEALLYAQIWQRIVINTFADQLPSDVRLAGGDLEMRAIHLLMATPSDAWWDDVGTDAVETRDDILLRSLEEGLTAAYDACGGAWNALTWGSRHTATFVSNPLGRSGVGLIESFVNRGPIAVGGATDAVNSMRWSASSGTFAVTGLPALRMVVDLADLSQSIAVHSTGQSGHPASTDYDSMIPAWRSCEGMPLLWEKPDVVEAAIHRLTLSPAVP